MILVFVKVGHELLAVVSGFKLSADGYFAQCFPEKEAVILVVICQQYANITGFHKDKVCFMILN
jgi:hypothetical protein